MSDFLSYPRQDVFETTLSADIGAADVLIPLNDTPDFSMTTGGSNSFYVVIDPDKPSTKIEIAKCDGISGVNLNVLSRGIAKYEGGASTAQSHSAGAKVYISDNWQTWKDIYTAIASKLNAAGGTATGPINFSGASASFTIPNLTTTEKNALTPANGMLVYDTTLGEFQYYDGGAWQSVGTASIPNASETVAGIIELATDAEITAGTSTGSTGARLVAPNDTLKTNLEAKFATASSVQSGSIVYAADGGGTDAYAITLSPVPSSYTTGMMINFTANTINTGAATLNINSLGAKTIKKNYNADLEDGDILANQINTVIYDGTNFQLVSRQENVYDLVTITRNISATSGTVNYSHALGKTPRRIDFEMVSSTSAGQYSHGAYVSGKNYCIFGNSGSTGGHDETVSITWPSNHTGVVSAVTTSNFTINWTKVGTPGSTDMYILAKVMA